MKEAMAPKQQIIAMGGGGLLMGVENSALDRYILSQARRATPRVTFLGTASGDDAYNIAGFYAAFTQYDCQPTHLTFFQRTPDLCEHLLQQDVIYVGGGNTRSMLAVWYGWELRPILEEAYRQGVVLAGVSAGAICWYERGVTDSFALELQALDCLGFLPGSCCPHYNELERRTVYHNLVADGDLMGGVAIDDGAAVHYVNGEVSRVVAESEGAQAYRVEQEQEAAVEETMDVDLLE